MSHRLQMTRCNWLISVNIFTLMMFTAIPLLGFFRRGVFILIIQRTVPNEGSITVHTCSSNMSSILTEANPPPHDPCKTL